MLRATQFRSFSPLSWPSRKSRASQEPRGRVLSMGLSEDDPLERESPFDDEAYERDLEVVLRNAVLT